MKDPLPVTLLTALKVPCGSRVVPAERLKVPFVCSGVPKLAPRTSEPPVTFSVALLFSFTSMLLAVALLLVKVPPLMIDEPPVVEMPPALRL